MSSLKRKVCVSQKVNTVLEELVLLQHNVEDEAAEALADMLQCNQTLKLLRISYISDKAVCSLANALHTNTTLENLLLMGDIKHSGFEKLAAMLSPNKTLKILEVISHSHIEQATPLILALNSETALQELSLFMDVKHTREADPADLEAIKDPSSRESINEAAELPSEMEQDEGENEKGEESAVEVEQCSDTGLKKLHLHLPDLYRQILC